MEPSEQLLLLTTALAVFVDDGRRRQRRWWVEPTAPIVVIDGGIGSLCRQWSSSMEVAAGWSQKR